MPLAEDIADLVFVGARFFFLLGAGASISANVPLDSPTAEGLAWKLALSELGSAEAARAKYGSTALQLPNLFPHITKRIFRDLLRKQNWQILSPTTCHNVLALIIAEGYQVEIGTINYDPLAEKAFRNLKEQIHIVAAPDTLQILRDGKRAVLKIHGCPYSDSDPDHLLVTQQELLEGRAWIRTMLEGRLQERYCVYVGFSGNVPYVLESVAATIAALGEHLIASYAIDAKPTDEVFHHPPATPLASFVEALGIPRAHYSDMRADPFCRALGNRLVRRILRQTLAEATGGGVAVAVAGAEQIGNAIAEILEGIEYEYAYDWISRLCGVPRQFKGLRREKEIVLAAFRVIILLIGAEIINLAAIAPVLAFPFRQINPGPSIVIFGGNGNMLVDQLAQEISERFKTEEFRQAIGCENGDTVIAVAVRCLGRPTQQTAAIIPEEPDSLRAADKSPFVWLSEDQLHQDFEHLNQFFRP